MLIGSVKNAEAGRGGKSISEDESWTGEVETVLPGAGGWSAVIRHEMSSDKSQPDLKWRVRDE